MRSSISVYLLFALIASAYSQNTCILSGKRCAENECCLFRFIGPCVPLRQENEPCSNLAGLLSCPPCAPGLECVRRGRGRSVCVASSTTAQPSTTTMTSTTVFPSTTTMTSTTVFPSTTLISTAATPEVSSSELTTPEILTATPTIPPLPEP